LNSCTKASLEAIEAGRPRGFFLQGEVHALMPAVLLGLAGLDALDPDAEAFLTRCRRDWRHSRFQI
jgi:hypothetical protein